TPGSSAETADTTTRSSGPRVIAKHLAAIKRIYVDSLGGGQFGDSVRISILDALDKTGQLKAVETQDQADAVLRGTAVGPGQVKGKLSIKLIAADGSTLWSWPHPGSASNTIETPSRLAALVTTDLIEKIHAARAQ